jgi:CDP-6-deoxy-D-xylo-4-hexulose-3-dehydrase
MSSNSFYFGHHVSTIEGGMINTNDREVYKLLVSLRNHGWNRDWNEDEKKEIEKQYNIEGINALFTFYYPGLNMRSTDLQAFIGLGQLKKIDAIIQKRNENYKLYQKLIKNEYWMPKDDINSFTSNFAFPVIHPKKNQIIEELKRNEIETRPLICGSMGKQPFYVNAYGKKELKNCNIVDDYGIYIPNHPYLSNEDIHLISETVNKGISK